MEKEDERRKGKISAQRKTHFHNNTGVTNDKHDLPTQQTPNAKQLPSMTSLT
jgi:hypothetical protein